jgi:hypothetical protein
VAWLVSVVVLAAACAPSTPDENSWRAAARRAISDVSSAVQTARLALREDEEGHLYGSYVQTVAVDAEELAGSGADSLASVQPPEAERQRYDAVTAQLDDAASLLSEVRIAVVAGHTGSYPDLVEKLADAVEGLDKLDQDLMHPPGAASGL